MALVPDRSLASAVSRLFGVACLAVPLIVGTTIPLDAGDTSVADAYIVDDSTPSREFGPGLARKLEPLTLYPPAASGILLPEDWARRQFANQAPMVKLARSLVADRAAAANRAAFYAWLGITAAPIDPRGEFEAVGAYPVQTQWGPGLTFGCVTCHSQNLFGTLVVGMSNKSARANLLFVRAKAYLQQTPVALLGARDADETALLKRTQRNLRSVGARRPLALGLDTAFAQVSLSLARRGPDTTATRSDYYAAHPRPDPFDWAVADSKPMDWWLVKYKDRFLSDGSLTTRSVIPLAYLFNEIGRGTDLVELESWLVGAPDAIERMERFVAATEPPRIEDFLDDPIDVAAARRGERHFLARCSGCHGVYRKTWSTGHRTVSVDYPRPTKVADVGTDPNRARGTGYVAGRVNRLDFSRRFGIVLQETGGYVPPPLVGIWSRYPYLHNRSVPNLCQLLTPDSERVRRFWVGTTENIDTDFDRACVGYPVGQVREDWKTRERLYDTRWTGLSNQGHNMFVDASAADKRDLIEFLKTL